MRLTLPLAGHGGTTAGFVIDPAIVDELGGGRRPKVVVTIGGQGFRTSIASMGAQFLLGVSNENRKLTGVSAGDIVEFDLTLDRAPRTVEVPPDFAEALAAVPGARDAFDRLADSRRKEHVRAIEEAKKPETRARRIDKAVEVIRATV
ncbi:MAG: YdeI/OmpD-associated family protein [Nostocoides sp.]